MTKYSFEFKLKIVHDYLSGQGGTPFLAKKYGFQNNVQIRKWINTYKEFGEEGLLRSWKNKHYSVQFKLDAIELYLTTELSYREVANYFKMNNPSLIANWLRMYRKLGIDGLSKQKGRPTTMPKKKSNETQPLLNEPSQLEILEKENRMLKIENAYLKELRRLRLEDEQKMKKSRESFTVSEDFFRLKDILETLRFPKATYMYWQKRFDRTTSTQLIEEEIQAIRKEHQHYGYRRMTQELKRRGYQVNKKKVQRLIQKLQLQVIAFTNKSRKYNSYKGTVGKVARNLIYRRFTTSVLHQKITTDTTEFKYFERDEAGILRQKKLYLDPFMDMYNREILSYSLSNQPNGATVMAGLKEAISQTNDCPYRRTFHSDQGWAYQMNIYVQTLKENRIFQSMSRKGTCLDNSPMENFFSILKQELYYGKVYQSQNELRLAIENYIYYYNHYRIKEKLNWKSPVEFRLFNQTTA
ncbi:IS3 family transposase [Listeria cossartiae]|nr:IS3 family transposase [Listeria cossartiae]MCD2240599.1 IS3 family transposase [Listeria cossartiae]